ncbi:hypothetical protein F5B22DRAFT_464871 [Xylaria bambusicola]|uniref:uncharacterized protein n=1 Tax=Xylaria bambusicola TaxID=326684 RepID=UPI0020078EFE|nr:uncharacterized protein F5B22DRAFT_464871 [Xylaria bambusicola]KAI0522219.1 hypothetical protein F5B22DRAFT_464871 [Xylaria bambusicola]
MEQNTQGAELLIDFSSNLPEMLAVDLEQSSEIFQSRQLTAGAPAPWLADDGARRQYSPENDASYVSSESPSQSGDTLPNSKQQQPAHQKYFDIFAPLDFNAPKHDSISSSHSSQKSEPPPLSTREESVLTVDTLFEPEKNPSPTFLHLSPTSDCNAQMSWIDLDIEDTSPITQRRRSSMSDFPKYLHQLRGSMEASVKTIRPRRSIDATEISVHPVNGNPLNYPIQIPRRRSSLQYQETQAVAPQSSQHLGRGRYNRDASYFASHGLFNNESPFAHGKEANTTSRQYEDDCDPVSPTFKKDMPDIPSTDENDRDRIIASAAVGFNEWLDSDIAHFASEDQFLPRPLPHNVQETIKFFVTKFPEPVLLCDSLLIENIRTLTQQVRYNTNEPKIEHTMNSGQQSNNQQPSKRWKWLHSSANATEQQDRPSTFVDVNKRGWDVMKKIFPSGSDGLCEALYAYVLVYNYITLLCSRSPLHAVDSSRPTTPWTGARPETAKSSTSCEFKMYMSTPPQPSVTENGIPRKAACILGMKGEDVFGPSISPTQRPPSGGSESRTSTFTSLRGIPSLLFNGTGPAHQRQSESRGATPTGQRSNFSRPATPSVGLMGMRSTTSMGSHTTDQGKQLAELRHGVAMCCARLTITLHRADLTITNRKTDKDCKVDPSFMRSLCENVRITEEAMARSRSG